MQSRTKSARSGILNHWLDMSSTPWYNILNKNLNFTYCLISFSVKRDLLTMLHSLLNMHLHYLLFWTDLVTFAVGAPISLINDLTWIIRTNMVKFFEKIRGKNKKQKMWIKYMFQLITWPSAIMTDMLHLLDHAWCDLPGCNLQSWTLAAVTSCRYPTLWTFPEIFKDATKIWSHSSFNCHDETPLIILNHSGSYKLNKQVNLTTKFMCVPPYSI